MALMQRVQRRATWQVYSGLEGAFRKLERSHFSRGSVLERIPPPQQRGGGLGTITYGEWAYMIGSFQTLIFHHLPAAPVRMLDVGCGVGRLYLAAKPYLLDGGAYHGIDVGRDFIDICKARYREPNVSFTHLDVANGYYAKDVAEAAPKRWPIADAANNFITALSVWTHLREEDFRFYLHEVSRVLAPGGRAMLTFFILDDLYRPEKKTDAQSAYYPQPMSKWVFGEPAYQSKEWFTTAWADVPEVAIAVPYDTFQREVADAGLNVVRYYPGQWKDQPGLAFQDVVVFEKI